MLQNLSLNDIKSEPPSCTCSTSPFLYTPAEHVVTGDLNIVQNSHLKELLKKGPKYRQPQPFNWNHNFKLLMDSVEDYARRWTKREEVEVDTLSEWLKAVRTLIKSRVKNLKGSLNTKPKSVLDDPDVKLNLSELHDKYVIVPVDKASNNMVFVCSRLFG